MREQLSYGNMPVPYSVLWSEEVPMRVEHCKFANWNPALCNLDARGAGKPIFGKPHMQRQREVITLGLCDLCARPLKGRTKVSLSHAKVRAGAEGPCVMQVEPMLHKECAALSMLHCPSLKRDIRHGGLEVRMVSRYRVQIAILTDDAVLEFTGQRKTVPMVAGHAKVELMAWVNKGEVWLR